MRKRTLEDDENEKQEAGKENTISDDSGTGRHTGKHRLEINRLENVRQRAMHTHIIR